MSVVSSTEKAFQRTLQAQEQLDTAGPGRGVFVEGTTTKIVGVAEGARQVTSAEARQTVEAFHMSPAAMRHALVGSNLSGPSIDTIKAEIDRNDPEAIGPMLKNLAKSKDARETIAGFVATFEGSEKADDAVCKVIKADDELLHASQGTGRQIYDAKGAQTGVSAVLRDSSGKPEGIHWGGGDANFAEALASSGFKVSPDAQAKLQQLVGKDTAFLYMKPDGSFDLSIVKSKTKADAPSASNIAYLRLATSDMHISSKGDAGTAKPGTMVRAATQHGTPAHPEYTTAYLKLAS